MDAWESGAAMNRRCLGCRVVTPVGLTYCDGSRLYVQRCP